MLPMDFIDTDRPNAREIHVGAAPRHGHRHRPKHLIPTGAEDTRGLLPTEALGPAGEKPHVGRRQLVLAVAPGHLFDRDATARARDAPHHIQEEDAQAPERHELEPARGQSIVHAAAVPTTRALRPVAAMRRDLDRQRQAADLLLELDRAVDKSSLFLNSIQDSLDLHPAVRLRDPGVCGNHHSLRVDAGCIPCDAARVEAASPVDAQNAPTGLCKTADGFAQLPQRLIAIPSGRTKTQNRPESFSHRPTDSAEEAFLLTKFAN